MSGPLEFVTPDDACWCRLCDPPYETSLAMIGLHLSDIHGIDPQDIVEAEVLDFTDPREVGA